MIAMALASEPKLIIADDPTRGMEVSSKAQILKLLTRVNQVRKTSILFVSHDQTLANLFDRQLALSSFMQEKAL